MEKSPNNILESRQELMISPAGEVNPILRTAHFLKPSTASIDEPFGKLPSNFFPSVSSTFKTPKMAFNLTFKGWRLPQRKWKTWVGRMVSLHQSTWKKAGIYEAILNSTYEIHRNNDLIFGVAERWCSETRSFIFPWGEATITLEDMVISGYSVLGSPVFSPLETENMSGIKKKLIQARKETVKSTARKASQSLWMKKFKDSGSEIEHEAFLALWLSRYVFPTSFNVIHECSFPTAIHLARGTRVALAPAVLASIYRDLSLLKEKIVSLATKETDLNRANKDVATVTIRSPFQLVQVWLWERIVELQPKPNLIKEGEPRLSRWDKQRCEVRNVRLVLDSAKDSFMWRPYAKTLKNWVFPRFYTENETWVMLDSRLYEEFLPFVRCLRASALVGLDCIEKYFPHRVAMQFGYDQDLPGCFDVPTYSPEILWSDYSRPTGAMKLYIPSRLFKADVTTRYREWWKQSMLALQGVKEGVIQQHRSLFAFGTASKSVEGNPKRSNSSKIKCRCSNGKKSSYKTRKDGRDIAKYFRILPKVSNGNMGGGSFGTIPEERKKGDDASSSLCFPPNTSSETCPRSRKRKNVDALDACEAFTSKKSDPSFKGRNEENGSSSPLCSSQSEKNLSPSYIAMINNSPVPPGFLPKCNEVEARDDSVEEDNLTIAEALKFRYEHVRNRQGGDVEKLSGQCENHSISDTDTMITKIREPLTTSMEEDVESEAVETKQVGDGGTSSRQCPTAQKRPLRNSEPLASAMDSVRHTGGVVEGLERIANDADRKTVTAEGVHAVEGGNTFTFEIKTPGLKLEARIARLEKKIEGLKAARLGLK